MAPLHDNFNHDNSDRLKVLVQLVTLTFFNRFFDIFNTLSADYDLSRAL